MPLGARRATSRICSIVARDTGSGRKARIERRLKIASSTVNIRFTDPLSFTFKHSNTFVVFVHSAIEISDLNCTKDATTHRREVILSEQSVTGTSI